MKKNAYAKFAAEMRANRRAKVAAAIAAYPELIESAKAAARNAYAAGYKAPAVDPAFAPLLTQASACPDGTVLAILEAWTAEYQAVHLTAVGLA